MPRAAPALCWLKTFSQQSVLECPRSSRDRLRKPADIALGKHLGVLIQLRQPSSFGRQARHATCSAALSWFFRQVHAGSSDSANLGASCPRQPSAAGLRGGAPSLTAESGRRLAPCFAIWKDPTADLPVALTIVTTSPSAAAPSGTLPLVGLAKADISRPSPTCPERMDSREEPPPTAISSATERFKSPPSRT